AGWGGGYNGPVGDLPPNEITVRWNEFMTPWSARESFDVLVVGRRLLEVLFGVTVYCVAAGAVIIHFKLPAVNWGSATALINTVILSLLLSFRNSAAYQRWWEARGLWGKLVNDSRNFAAKCAAFVPAE